MKKNFVNKTWTRCNVQCVSSVVGRKHEKLQKHHCASGQRAKAHCKNVISDQIVSWTYAWHSGCFLSTSSDKLKLFFTIVVRDLFQQFKTFVKYRLFSVAELVRKRMVVLQNPKRLLARLLRVTDLPNHQLNTLYKICVSQWKAWPRRWGFAQLH